MCIAPSSSAYAEVLSMCRAASGRLVVLTGAGLSTESGIPDYRSPAGSYSKGHKPMQHDEFVGSTAARVRYWSRSMRGWGPFSSAVPNAGHRSLAALERAGLLQLLISQNVDGLHSKAGHREVIELHGTSHTVRCLACGATETRKSLQARLVALNYWQLATRRSAAASEPIGLDAHDDELRADGDAAVVLAREEAAAFRVPACRQCGGILKPDVTFFGDAVPAARAAAAQSAAESCAALLIAGTSVSTLSAYRLAEAAHAAGAPIAVLNLGPTRLERSPRIPHLKLEASCGETLARLARDLIGDDVRGGWQAS